MATIEAPWADTPFNLIPTPGRGEDVSKLPAAVFIAREMTCAHNGMLRGLNSIYQQSTHVIQPQDIKDLLKYAEFWCGWIHEHHDAEEQYYFPEVERLTGMKGRMAKNVAQHYAFMPGLENFGSYLTDTSVEEYDGLKLRAIVDSFGEVLAKHLSEEIETLLELKAFDEAVMRKAYDEFDLKLRAGDKSILFPIVLGTTDIGYEGNCVWPELPGFVKSLVHYWYERKYQGVWRFSPCSTWGEKRPLTFTAKVI
ncbi:uncharacterized protein RAG0_11084 [Rhynchosporium agropyri]|uniref:Hemerythrin-like domain-containing protein n=1 Tax=Rhynchosporium agropyri TaxID=914238 RepID=A0A1E1L2J2_9HELO|nr:uncharacterized protein RAG0_11084 [Rhynchosporium agropyri]